MCAQKLIKTAKFLVFSAVFAMIFINCEAMDALFPSAGGYRVNFLINDISADDCSFISLNDIVRPYFEEPILGDPDVTALMIYLRDFDGEPAGIKMVYTLKKDDEFDEDDVIIVSVKNLDNKLPNFPLPDDLPAGRYSLVANIMSGKNILQRTEKQFYYLGDNYFSFKGISTYLPGIIESSHIIPRDTTIMLELNMVFDVNLDPYIIWYEGRNRISEGRFSDGESSLFWKTPEQTGFFSIHAEVFPAADFIGLAGYQKGVSLLVSSMAIDVHLVSRDIPQLLHRYIFEGNVNDSKMTATPENALRPAARNIPKWKGANRTYGLAAGFENVMMLPEVDVPNSATSPWQILFRFLPLNDGGLFTVQLGSLNNIYMHLSIYNRNLVLSLTSPASSVSQIIKLPESSNNFNSAEFLTAGVNLSLQSGVITANMNILGNLPGGRELTLKPISIETRSVDTFRILLGFTKENDIIPDQLLDKNAADESSEQQAPEENKLPEYTAIWDEFILYYMPPMEDLFAEKNPAVSENENISHNL